MEYHVIWNIDIEAESFKEAARTAREIQLDRHSLATHFIAIDANGRTRQIDLDGLRDRAIALKPIRPL